MSHSDIFGFQDIAYMFSYNFTIFFLNGLVYHCREQDKVCSPYSVESVFFKLLTLAPMMPKQSLIIGGPNLRPVVDQGIFATLRTRT